MTLLARAARIRNDHYRCMAVILVFPFYEWALVLRTLLRDPRRLCNSEFWDLNQRLYWASMMGEFVGTPHA